MRPAYTVHAATIMCPTIKYLGRLCDEISLRSDGLFGEGAPRNRLHWKSSDSSRSVNTAHASP